MSAKLDICNQALSHLAVSTEVQDFDTEKSKEAQAVRRFYELARMKVLRDYDWPFANTVEFLALLANPPGLTQPTVEWTYAYRYPASAIAVRRILNQATRVDTVNSRVIYSIGRDSVGRIIYSSLATAQIQYTYNETDPERFPPDFVVALSFYLAFLIGPRVAGGDQYKLADRAYGHYQRALLEAQANAAGEEPSDNPPASELELSRD